MAFFTARTNRRAVSGFVRSHSSLPSSPDVGNVATPKTCRAPSSVRVSARSAAFGYRRSNVVMALATNTAASIFPCSSAAIDVAELPTETTPTSAGERPWDTRRKFKNWWVGDLGEVTPTRRPFKSVIVRILPSIAGATTSDKVGLEYITRKQRT